MQRCSAASVGRTLRTTVRSVVLLRIPAPMPDHAFTKLHSHSRSSSVSGSSALAAAVEAAAVRAAATANAAHTDAGRRSPSPSVAEPRYHMGILPVSASSSKFVDGYRNFRELHYVESTGLYEKLKLGQSPTTMVITCSDSRVDPALITAAEPGDLFVVRYVANIVPHPTHPASLAVYAALNYAVNVLNVQNILVLGHSSCGGINALMEAPAIDPLAASETAATPGGITPDNAINLWMGLAQPAKVLVASSDTHDFCSHERNALSVPNNITREKYYKNVCCEQMNVVLALDNLLQYQFISQRVKTGKLVLHGWWNDLQAGRMYAYDGQKSSFVGL